MRYLLGITKNRSQGKSSLKGTLNQLLSPSSDEIVYTYSLNALLSYVAIEEFDAIWVNWSLVKEFYNNFHARLEKINKKIPLIIIVEEDHIDGMLCENNEMLFSE